MLLEQICIKTRRQSVKLKGSCRFYFFRKKLILFLMQRLKTVTVFQIYLWCFHLVLIKILHSVTIILQVAQFQQIACTQVTNHRMTVLFSVDIGVHLQTVNSFHTPTPPPPKRNIYISGLHHVTQVFCMLAVHLLDFFALRCLIVFLVAEWLLTT